VAELRLGGEVDEVAVEVELAVEVLVDAALGDAYGVDDATHRRRAVVAQRELVQRRVDEAPALVGR